MVTPTLSATTCAAHVVERVGALKDLQVVCGKRAAFTARQILRRLKTESCRVADRAYATEIMDCPVRLRGVLEQNERMTFRDIAQGSHVARLAKQVHGHDRARLTGNDRLLDPLRIEQVCLWIDVNERHAKLTIEHGG